MAAVAAPKLTKGPQAPVAEQPEPADLEEPAPLSARMLFASTALTILAALLLGLVAQLVLIGRVQHYRAQRIEYADLRNTLAQGTAPVSALTSDGKALPLGTPVALLEIPVIGLREVVGYGTTSQVLARGPGLRRDSPFPGQPGTSVIMGRRAAYGGPFARLSKLQVGDRITVTTGQGVQHFAVLDVRRPGDATPAVAGANEGRLMLMTALGAAYIPSGILRVDAKLSSAVQPAGPVAFSNLPLPRAETALQGEPGAWLAIVLWSQALFLAVLAFVFARLRWGFWQSWVIGIPIIAAIGIALADSVIRLFPNLM